MDSKADGACQWAGIGAGKMQRLQWAKGRTERCAVTADVTGVSRGERKCAEGVLPGLRGSYIAGNGLVACRAIRWSWGSAAPKEWCIPLRVAKEGGRGGTMGSSGHDKWWWSVRCSACDNGGSICNGCNGFGSIGRGFGAAACFRMWWFAQLKLFGFASGAEAVQRGYVEQIRAD